MEFFAGFKFLSSVEKKKIIRVHICVEANRGMRSSERKKLVMTNEVR